MSVEMVRLTRERTTGGLLPAGFERLFEAEYARVVRIAQRALGDRAEAEDVAQEVFLSFYRSERADAEHAGPWLYAAAAHAALNVVRARKRRVAREERAAQGPAAEAVDPEAALLAAERRDVVREALARMPARGATALVLRYSGLSYAEVATALGVKADQVGTLLRRAEDTFKKEVLRDG